MTETNAYYHHPGLDAARILDDALTAPDTTSAWVIETFNDRPDDDVIPLPDGRVSVPRQLLSELNWLRGFRQGVIEGLHVASDAKSGMMRDEKEA